VEENFPTKRTLSDRIRLMEVGGAVSLSVPCHDELIVGSKSS